MSGFDGMGKDAETVENEHGGRQSKSPARLDLVPAKAMFNVGHILGEGAKKYGIDNWRKIECEDHINHVLCHIFAYLGGDTQDDHVGHATCRMMMADEQFINGVVRKPKMMKAIRMAYCPVCGDVVPPDESCCGGHWSGRLWEDVD